MSIVFLIVASFLASAVDMVEALTIVLAVGLTRGGRGGGVRHCGGRGCGGACAVGAGAGEYVEIRGRRTANDVRDILGRGRRGSGLAGERCSARRRARLRARAGAAPGAVAAIAA